MKDNNAREQKRKRDSWWSYFRSLFAIALAGCLVQCYTRVMTELKDLKAEVFQQRQQVIADFWEKQNKTESLLMGFWENDKWTTRAAQMEKLLAGILVFQNESTARSIKMEKSLKDLTEEHDHWNRGLPKLMMLLKEVYEQQEELSRNESNTRDIKMENMSTALLEQQKQLIRDELFKLPVKIKIAMTTEINGKSLVEASISGSLDKVEYLIDRGVNVNYRDKLGTTPIYHATREGHLAVVKYLLDHGADINCTTDYGYAPLHDSAGRGHLEVVQHLLQEGADKSVKCHDGKTPYDMIGMFGGSEDVKNELRNLLK